MKYSTPPPGRRRISAPSQFGSNNTTSWHIPGPPPPPPGTAQPDGECTESSDPSPIAPSAAYFGQGPSPGPSVSSADVGSSGYGQTNRFRPGGMVRSELVRGGRARWRERCMGMGVELCLCLWRSTIPTTISDLNSSNNNARDLQRLYQYLRNHPHFQLRPALLLYQDRWEVKRRRRWGAMRLRWGVV